MSTILHVDHPVYGGHNLASTQAPGEPSVRVAFALSGETVEAEIRGTEARPLRILAPSPARTEPRCRHFGACGGCQYQMADYDEQLHIKREILTGLLHAAQLEHLPPIEAHSAASYGYRNRIRLRVGRADGALRFGYNVRATQQFLPITECPIAAPQLWQTAEALLAAAADDQATMAWLSGATELELFVSDDASRVQLTLLCPPRTNLPRGSFARMMQAIGARAPQVVGAGAVALDPRVGLTGKVFDSWGAAGLQYRVPLNEGEETYWVSRGGFFQVNRFLLPKLVELVTIEGGQPRGGNLAWDLFAGVGLFSRVLARSFTQVTAVESAPSAANDLQGALRKLGKQHRAIAQTTTDFLRSAIIQRERPDLVVLDPPRAGAGAEACELLVRLRAPQIVYVSCDPTTLARDLEVLQAAYRIVELHLVDLFPQTFHMETVAVLQRRA